MIIEEYYYQLWAMAVLHSALMEARRLVPKA